MLYYNVDSNLLPFCDLCSERVPFFQFIEGEEINMQIHCLRCKDMHIKRLNEYLKIFDEYKINGGEEQKCQMLVAHQDRSVKATKYCPQCGQDQRWLCNLCASYHEQFCKDHRSSPIEEGINFECKEHTGYQFQYFCNECKKHLCKFCGENHNFHPLIDLRIESEKIRHIDIERIKNEYKDNLNQLKNKYIEKAKRKIEAIDRLIEGNIRNNYSILDLIGLIYRYFKMNQINHYYILQNILQNKINEKVDLNIIKFKNLEEYCKNHLVVPIIRTKEPSIKSSINPNDNFNNINHNINSNHFDSYNSNRIPNNYNNNSNIPEGDKEIIIMTKELFKKEFKYWLRSIEGITENGKVTKIAACSSDGKIVIYDANNLEHFQTLSEHNMGVNTLCQLNETYLISGADDKNVVVWGKNLGKFKKERIIADQKDEVKKIVKIKNGFALSSKNNTIQIFNDTFTKEDSKILTNDSPIKTILAIDRMEKLVSVDENGSLIFWNFNNPQQVKSVKEVSCNFPNSIYEFENHIFISGRLRNKNRNQQSETFWMINYDGKIVFSCGGINGFSFLGIKDVLFIGTADGTIKCFFLNNRNVKDIKNGDNDHRQHINGFAKINDGLIATCSTDCKVKLWKIKL